MHKNKVKNQDCRGYLFMLVPFSSRRGSNAAFVEKCHVRGTGRFDEVTNSVVP